MTDRVIAQSKSGRFRRLDVLQKQAERMLDRQLRHIENDDDDAYVSPDTIVTFIAQIAPLVRKRNSRYVVNDALEQRVRSLLLTCAALPIFVGESLETLAIEVTASDLSRGSCQLIELALQADVLQWNCSCEVLLAPDCSIASIVGEPACPSERCSSRLESISKERLDHVLLLLLARRDPRIDADLRLCIDTFATCPFMQHVAQRCRSFSTRFRVRSYKNGTLPAVGAVLASAKRPLEDGDPIVSRKKTKNDVCCVPAEDSCDAEAVRLQKETQ